MEIQVPFECVRNVFSHTGIRADQGGPPFFGWPAVKGTPDESVIDLNIATDRFE